MRRNDGMSQFVVQCKEDRRMFNNCGLKKVFQHSWIILLFSFSYSSSYYSYFYGPFQTLFLICSITHVSYHGSPCTIRVLFITQTSRCLLLFSSKGGKRKRRETETSGLYFDRTVCHSWLEWIVVEEEREDPSWTNQPLIRPNSSLSEPE